MTILDRDGTPLALGDPCLIVVWRDRCAPTILGLPIEVGAFWAYSLCVRCGSLYDEPVVSFREPYFIPGTSIGVAGCPASWLKKLPPLAPADAAETLGYERLAEAIRSSTLVKEKT